MKFSGMVLCLLSASYACQVHAQIDARDSLSTPAQPSTELLIDFADEFDASKKKDGSACREDRIDSLLNNGFRSGFGASTTGGAKASNVTTVYSLADSGPGTLRDAIEQGGPRWIVFDEAIYGGTILLESPITVPRDITIDGRGNGMMSDVVISPSDRSTHVMLMWEGNVIVHGVTIDGRETGATGIMLRTGDNYWIDQVTTTGFRSDDSLTVGHGAKSNSTSEVTISNYHTYDTDKGFLAGGEIEFFDTYRTHRVTIFHSLLNARDRNPHISAKGQVHLYNNVIVPAAWTGVDIRHGARALVENNVISGEQTNDPNSSLLAWRLASTGRPTGHIFSVNNSLIAGAGGSGSINPDSVPRFDIPYEYSLYDTDQVEAYVRSHAGAANGDHSLLVCD